MRITTARFNLNVKQFSATVLLIAAAGSAHAENTAAGDDKGAQADLQQVIKHQTKSAIKRQKIQKKVADREPLSYEETLYLR